jgi:hypothetical protein
MEPYVERAMGIEHVVLTINPLIMSFCADSIVPLFPWQFKGISLIQITGSNLGGGFNSEVQRRYDASVTAP